MPAGKNAAAATEVDDRKPTDPVDWASHYWEKRELGDHQEAFLAMSSTMRLHRILVDSLEKELKNFGLNLTDYLLLMTLVLSENGTRLLSRLAWNLMVHATTITLATDRLEAQGLLRREAHPTDRRATCVTISDKGMKLALKATDALKQIEFGLTGSNPAGQRQLITVLAAMRSAAGDVDRIH